MKTIKTKLPKLVEIVWDMYPDLFFGEMSWKPLKISEKGVHRPVFSKYSFITPSRGWQWVAVGDMTNWFKCTYCVNGQVATFKMCHDFVILRILKKEDNRAFVCYFHIIHLYKQTMNRPKYLVPTFNNQEESIYIPKSIGHFSPLMLPLAVCQLRTS